MTNNVLLQRLYRTLRPYRAYLFIAILCMIMHSASATGQAWIMKPVMDDIFIKKDISLLALMPLVLIFIFSVKAITYYIYTFLLEKVGQSVIRDLRTRIYTHINTQPLSFFHDHSTGTLISRIISDVALMQQSVSNALVSCIKDFFQFTFLIGYVFFLNWKMAMITLVILPIAAVPIIKFGRLFRRLSIRTQEETAKVSDRLYETFTGNRIVKAFSMEEFENERFRSQHNSLFSIIIKDARFRAMQHPMMELIGGLAIAVIVWFFGKEVLAGNATPGEFASFIVALILAYEPVKGISRINPYIQQGMAASTRVFRLLDIAPQISDKPGAAEMAPFKETISFEQVQFNYPGEPRVLHDINLSVPTGEALAIVGASGGGKTTLTNLVPRFLDIQGGAIRFDGVDIRDVTMSSLRKQIAMVTQQTILFNDSIRYNIAYGNLDATDQDIIAAAEAAYALEFIENLPDGFDTIIGESGARLSGGERQRISIARAILKNAPILILDEATSALDTESERQVQRALENLMKNRTTFVIAHRLSTIKNCDRIIVIKDGRIVEQGTHNELLTQHGEYEMLYTMQYSEPGKM